MSNIFLTAEWRNLLMANYEIQPSVLNKYLPYRTELDDFNGVHYISLVGFLFTNTRVRGWTVPFHNTFEEVNLRFYVRFKSGQQWKRGVVFIKEIVPKKMISFVANTFYKENYATHQMKHVWNNKENLLEVEYYWKWNHEWNYLKAIAEKEPQLLIKGSEEEFITEHYWGYTFINKKLSGEYEVAHPSWRIHAIKEYAIFCSAALYGNDFSTTLTQTPKSVFLAEGSAIQVMKSSGVTR